jgi:hypothetical protein
MPKRIPFVRWSNVFNLEQTEGIEPPALTVSQNELSASERAAAIVQKAETSKGERDHSMSGKGPKRRNRRRRGGSSQDANGES